MSYTVGTSEWYEERKHLPILVFKTYPFEVRNSDTGEVIATENIDFYFPMDKASVIKDEHIMPLIQALMNIRGIINDQVVFEAMIIKNIKCTKPE